MGTGHTPPPLPATLTRRPWSLVGAVMAQSLREQGPATRTAAAWRWIVTGQGTSPITQTTGPGRPPTLEEIDAEACARDTAHPECATPLSRFDPDLDRRQARQVLRWLTGDADVIPLQDPERGRYVGARLHFVRTDEEIRRVRGWALHGIRQHGDLPEHMSRWDAEHPWSWPAWWMNAAWLRGTVAWLNWILGDSDVPPLTFKLRACGPADEYRARVYRVLSRPPTAEDITSELWHLSGSVMQGHEHQPPAEPDRYPPPQWGEAVEQTHSWLTGEDSKPPADHHGCGDYYPCPGLRRCSCEDAGYCLRGRCPACADKICNAAWSTIEDSY
jgi:hypothetical protein